MPMDVHNDLIRVRGSNRNWLWQVDTIPHLFGRATAQRRMWAMLVVPGSVTIQTTLQRGDAKSNTARHRILHSPVQRPARAINMHVKKPPAVLME